MKKAIPPAVHDHGGTAFYLFHFDHMQHVGHILLIPAAVGSRVACGEDGKLAFFYKAFAFTVSMALVRIFSVVSFVLPFSGLTPQ